MPPIVQVPLNTMLADLDESLRTLLRRELGRHGFQGVEIAFDAPSREWSAQLAQPTVDLFLYDLREAEEQSDSGWIEGNGARTRPPLRVEASYAVTAWTQAVEDEHRLLSQVLGVLYAYDTLPADVLAPRLADQPRDVETLIGKPRGEKADFWTAVGGEYKASLDYVVRLSAASGTYWERGPAVRTQIMRTRRADASGTIVEESARHGGIVRDADGEPVADAWVVLPDAGAWASTGADGRFFLQRVRAGSHKLIVRTPEGDETESVLEVPGAAIDILLTPRKSGRRG